MPVIAPLISHAFRYGATTLEGVAARFFPAAAGAGAGSVISHQLTGGQTVHLGQHELVVIRPLNPANGLNQSAPKTAKVNFQNEGLAAAQVPDSWMLRDHNVNSSGRGSFGGGGGTGGGPEDPDKKFRRRAATGIGGFAYGAYSYATSTSGSEKTPSGVLGSGFLVGAATYAVSSHPASSGILALSAATLEVYRFLDGLNPTPSSE